LLRVPAATRHHALDQARGVPAESALRHGTALLLLGPEGEFAAVMGIIARIMEQPADRIAADVWAAPAATCDVPVATPAAPVESRPAALLRASAPTPRADLAYMRPIALRTAHGPENPDFGQRTARSRRRRPGITVTFGHPAVP